MQVNASLVRIVVPNLAMPFSSSCVLLYVTMLRYAERMNLNEAGLVLTAGAIASFAAPLATAPLARLFGPTSLLKAALLTALAASFAIAWSPAVAVLLPAVVVLKFAEMVIVVLGSAELASRYHGQAHALLALQMAVVAVGGAVGPVYAGWVLNLVPIAEAAYPGLWLALGWSVLLCVCLLPVIIRGDYSSLPPHGSSRFSWRLGVIWGFLGLGVLHGICDIGAANWIAIWLTDRWESATALAAVVISVMWIGSFVGRLATIAIARLWGDRAALRIAAAGSAVGITLTVLAPSPVLVIAAFGFYCMAAAGNFPGLVSQVCNRCPQWRHEVTGLTIATINGAGVVATWTIGKVGIATGNLTIGMTIPAVAMILFALGVWLGPGLHRKVRKP